MGKNANSSFNTFKMLLFCVLVLGAGLLAEARKEVRPRCPKPLLGCIPGFKATAVGEDERGCPKFECNPVACPDRLLGCRPGTKETEVGKDQQGCPKFECEPIACPVP